MLQVNGCASGLTMYCSRILRMVHNYFTGGTYQFLMIAEHMLTLPTSALITLRCVLKKKRCLGIFGSLRKQRSRFRPALYLTKCKRLGGNARSSLPGPAEGAEPGGPGVEVRRRASVRPPGREACGEGGVEGGTDPQHMLPTFMRGVTQLGNSIRGRRRGRGSPGSLFPGRWRPGLPGGAEPAPLRAEVEGDESRSLRGGQPNFRCWAGGCRPSGRAPRPAPSRDSLPAHPAMAGPPRSTTAAKTRVLEAAACPRDEEDSGGPGGPMAAGRVGAPGLGVTNGTWLWWLGEGSQLPGRGGLGRRWSRCLGAFLEEVDLFLYLKQVMFMQRHLNDSRSEGQI